MNKKNESLAVGKDYTNVRGNNIIVIDRTGDITNRGFDGNNFEYGLFCSRPKVWREAAKEEVTEAFKKHLIHRYGKDWETMKIKKSHPDSTLTINDGSWGVDIFKTVYGWSAWNKNGLLYYKGIWVERLEEPRSTDWAPAPEDIEAMNKKEKSDKKRYVVVKQDFDNFKQLSLGDNKTNKIVAHFVEQDEEASLLAEKIVDILNLIDKTL